MNATRQTERGKNMNTNEPKHLESIGHACTTLQASYGAVRRALEEVGAEPAMIINGVAHYAESDVERAGERLRARAQGRPEAQP